jgi:hypothetical protein
VSFHFQGQGKGQCRRQDLSSPLVFVAKTAHATGDITMVKKRIAVVYDTSYLLGSFQSIKKFILAQRFSSQAKPGLLGILSSMIGGKGRAKSAPENTVYNDAEELLYVYEVLPKEVMNEVDQHVGDERTTQPAVASLLQAGAAKVDLSLDTVAGEDQGGRFTDQQASANPPSERDIDEALLRYAIRLGSHETNERYDLAVLATDDEALLGKIATMAADGKPVFGITSANLTTTRLLQDKLSQIASLDGVSRTMV